MHQSADASKVILLWRKQSCEAHHVVCKRSQRSIRPLAPTRVSIKIRSCHHNDSPRHFHFKGIAPFWLLVIERFIAAVIAPMLGISLQLDGVRSTNGYTAVYLELYIGTLARLENARDWISEHFVCAFNGSINFNPVCPPFLSSISHLTITITSLPLDRTHVYVRISVKIDDCDLDLVHAVCPSSSANGL